MTEYIKKEDAIEAIMCYFIPQVYTGEQVDQAKNIAESIMDGVPTIEASADCIDRYSALAELDPLSYEYKEITELPSVVPSKNLINRQDALDAIANFVPYVIDDISTESYTNGLKDDYNLICQLPNRESDEE